MTAILLILSGTGLVLTATVLAIVVTGIRQEPSELSTQAPRLSAALTRRLLGVCVRRPGPATQDDPCFSGTAPSWPEGRTR